MGDGGITVLHLKKGYVSIKPRLVNGNESSHPQVKFFLGRTTLERIHLENEIDRDRFLLYHTHHYSVRLLTADRIRQTLIEMQKIILPNQFFSYMQYNFKNLSLIKSWFLNEAGTTYDEIAFKINEYLVGTTAATNLTIDVGDFISQLLSNFRDPANDAPEINLLNSIDIPALQSELGRLTMVKRKNESLNKVSTVAAVRMHAYNKFLDINKFNKNAEKFGPWSRNPDGKTVTEIAIEDDDEQVLKTIDQSWYGYLTRRLPSCKRLRQHLKLQ